MRERHVIDAFKLLTAPVVLALMAWQHAWDVNTAWLYLGIHGTYGILWVTKSWVFPDRRWERPLSWWRAAMLFTGLAGYWVAPALICLRRTEAPGWLMAVATSLFGFGVFLHFGSDMQKHVMLAERSERLITSLLFSRIRNPNYLGEGLIYTSFALLAQHWLPWAVLGSIVAVEWVPNMLRKERSLARYPEFSAYAGRTKLVLPGIL
jgi:protein-S-isoprenylcysteine O-methyltransferase Ste14